MTVESFEDHAGHQVYVLHENEEWVVPLRREFSALGVPVTEWFLDRGMLDLSRPPPDGIF